MPFSWKNLRFNPKKGSSRSLRNRMREYGRKEKRKRHSEDEDEDSGSEKENRNIEGTLLREKVDMLQRQGRNERKRIKRRDERIETLENRVAEVEAENEIKKTRLEAAHDKLQGLEAEMGERDNDWRIRLREAEWKEGRRLQATAAKREEELRDVIDGQKSEITSAVEAKEEYKRRNHALSMKVARFPRSKEIAVQKAIDKARIMEWQVKDAQGAIRNDVRGLVRDLVSETNLGVEHVENVICRVLAAGGVSMIGNISVRSIGRIVIEGGVASDCQIADDVVGCRGLTVSGDGTSHKNLQYESRHIRVVRSDGTIQDLSLGVQTATNHTAETQLEGWKSVAEKIANAQREVYAYDKTHIPMDKRDFAIKTVGANSDHSDDQKKLWRIYQVWKEEADVEKRGEQSLLSMAPGELISALLDVTGVTIQNAGGWEAWQALAEDEKSVRHQTAYDQLCQKLGRDAVEMLPESEKLSRKEFFWVGCGMHKEMNATKGGDKAMQEFFQKNSDSMQAPMKYLNKDNRAAANSGSAEATARAHDVSKGGATKLTELAGSIFRNKDTKKGQQDTTSILTESLAGYGIVFPNTSNIRYASHGDAATVLIIHLKLWLQLLEIVKDKKGTGTWTNLEQNVYDGLQDIPTIHELCVLMLYSQSVTHPYLRKIRSTAKVVDGMDLGPIHNDLLNFLRRVINNTDVLLSSNATWETASFDGKVWDCPEAFYAVQHRLPDLPFIRPLLIAFFEGALETWERFNEEFAPGGAIARATSEQRSRVSIPATNDLNEGALGGKRRIKRNCPNMSNHAYNARRNYTFNKTSDYIKSMPNRAQKNLREVARKIDASGLVQQERKQQAAHDTEVARVNKGKAEEKDRRAARLAEQLKDVVILTLSELTDKLTLKVIELQLRWHRSHRKQHGLKTRAIPAPHGKADKLEVLKEVAEEYWKAYGADPNPSRGPGSGGSQLNTSQSCSVSEEDSEEDSDED